MPWPEPIRMSDDVRVLVDHRWAEYGIPERDVTGIGKNGARRLRLPTRR